MSFSAQTSGGWQFTRKRGSARKHCERKYARKTIGGAQCEEQQRRCWHRPPHRGFVTIQNTLPTDQVYDSWGPRKYAHTLRSHPLLASREGEERRSLSSMAARAGEGLPADVGSDGSDAGGVQDTGSIDVYHQQSGAANMEGVRAAAGGRNPPLRGARSVKESPRARL